MISALPNDPKPHVKVWRGATNLNIEKMGAELWSEVQEVNLNIHGRKRPGLDFNVHKQHFAGISTVCQVLAFSTTVCNGNKLKLHCFCWKKFERIVLKGGFCKIPTNLFQDKNVANWTSCKLPPKLNKFYKQTDASPFQDVTTQEGCIRAAIRDSPNSPATKNNGPVRCVFVHSNTQRHTTNFERRRSIKEYRQVGHENHG